MNDYWQAIARELLADSDAPGFFDPTPAGSTARVQWIGRACATLEEALRVSETADA